MMDDDKRLLVAKASLMAKRLAEDSDTGMRLTAKGYQVAYDKWMALDDEDKALYTLFFMWIATGS